MACFPNPILVSCPLAEAHPVTSMQSIQLHAEKCIQWATILSLTILVYLHQSVFAGFNFRRLDAIHYAMSSMQSVKTFLNIASIVLSSGHVQLCVVGIEV